MKTVLQPVSDNADEQVTIACVEVTQEIRNLQAYAESVGNCVTAVIDGKTLSVPLDDILYFEALDEKVFVYLSDAVGEVKGRLYEYEDRLGQKGFARISKSVLLHLTKLQTIRPTLGRKFMAELSGGECVVISRQYIKPLREILLGGNINEF
ncbi:MAG: LytTR family transcriptional regulator [Clostridia bacterium]|jgi:DNA-binding LytR/AlgR family response regulator|nr:LytTR family transcriptional regulator [Clostridia bacterium]MBQ5545756.1 LytTR family transcriptional regulator [Clostridia bacterium]